MAYMKSQFETVLSNLSRLPHDELIQFIKNATCILNKKIEDYSKQSLKKTEETEEPIMGRTKKNNKINEEKDIATIVSYLNDPIKGKAMRDHFMEQFPGRRLLAARLYDPTQVEKAGGRSTHYDFQIQLEDETWWNIEHKGSKDKLPISDKHPPWKNAVQCYNGGMSKFRIARKYAEEWYDMYIGSGYIHRTYLSSSSIPIPNKAEWIKYYANSQGGSKRPFGVALKQATYINGKSTMDILRDKFVPSFAERITLEDKKMLIEDILPNLKNALNKKNAWLQIAGDLSSGDYYCKWSPAVTINTIHDIQFTYGESDLNIIIHSDCQFPIGGPIRWGNGIGLCNIRLDIK